MLKIEGLAVSYGETKILRDLNMEVHPGEMVCLMGRNGVGKTTLLKSIMGLLRTNGRSRSRRYIEFLRSQFPQAQELKREESRIIVP